jgi:hypothetical protein
MTWEEIKQRKEESIRESTGNPMVKNPNPYEKNGKIYKSFSDYLKSDEYKEFLDIQEKAVVEYALKAKEYFDSLDVDNQLLLFFHVTKQIFENYFKDNGSYRGLLYDKFGFGPEAYSLGLDSGMFALHNAISTPDEDEERFQKFLKFMNLDLTKEQTASMRNYFIHGFDNSKQLNSIISGQLSINFTTDEDIP